MWWIRARKKPVVVDVWGPWDGSNKGIQELIDKCPSAKMLPDEDGFYAPTIETLEGTMRASVGDFVIVGVSGEAYPIKPEIFESTYEVA